jgi:hypothetical protein
LSVVMMASVMRSCPWEQALRVVGTGCVACDRHSLVAIAEYLFSLLSKLTWKDRVLGGLTLSTHLSRAVRLVCGLEATHEELSIALTCSARRTRP